MCYTEAYVIVLHHLHTSLNSTTPFFQNTTHSSYIFTFNPESVMQRCFDGLRFRTV